MTGRERSIFACLTDAVVAPVPPLPPVARTDAVPAMERQLAGAPAPARVGVRAALLAIEVLPRALGFGGRLRRLDAAQRIAVLERIDAHPQLSGVTKALRSLAHIAYYGDPQVMRVLGYDADAVVARAAALRAEEARW